MSIDLTHVATILEKTAAYIENVEASKLAEDTEQRSKAAGILAEKLTDATGEHFDAEMVSKLAGLEPEVTDVLSKLAGSGLVEPLGGPDDETRTVKTASAGVSVAEQRFIDFLTNP